MNNQQSSPGKSSQSGFTLTELMIALVLGLLVVLAATTMLVSSRNTYRTQDEGTRLQESARFARELANRIARMAGYINFGDSDNIPATYATTMLPNISGTNNQTGAPNNSDTLTIRFYGAGETGVIGSPMPVLDCTGTTVGAALNAGGAVILDERSVNTFYVALNAQNEPELYCSTTATASGGQALISGVESFQVLYGVETYPVTTTAPNAVNDEATPDKVVYKRADQMVTTNTWGSDWDFVRFIRVGILLRTAPGARTDQDTSTYQLFGPNYPTSSDPGTALTASALGDPSRLRRVVLTTVELRNRVKPWPVNE